MLDKFFSSFYTKMDISWMFLGNGWISLSSRMWKSKKEEEKILFCLLLPPKKKNFAPKKGILLLSTLSSFIMHGEWRTWKIQNDFWRQKWKHSFCEHFAWFFCVHNFVWCADKEKCYFGWVGKSGEMNETLKMH